VLDGQIKKGGAIRFLSTGKEFQVQSLGAFDPHLVSLDRLGPGEVGIFTASIRNVSDTKVGDTVTMADHPAVLPIPGFQEPKAMVFSGLYPTDNGEYEALRAGLEKLQLNDSAFSFEPETSVALGFGFRCGFLGLLHMDIIRERLEREYGLTLIITAPTVIYRVHLTDGKV
ncbi:MAG: elongation factor 4, partial [Candidatus Marinimicrobia bacterium]|nr:elongation factor 4 [Candidatus Neomarinimicrobiota bacterium]